MQSIWELARRDGERRPACGRTPSGVLTDRSDVTGFTPVTPLKRISQEQYQ